MELLIAHLGRLLTWLLFVAVLLLMGVILLAPAIRAVQSMVPDEPTAVPPPPPTVAVDPVQALAEGGHVVIVWARCGRDDEPMTSGNYEVDTHSGRPPERQFGGLTENMAQVVVGPDWVGQITISQLGAGTRERTDLIGEPFGWHERTITFWFC